jgi:hypothetical protein
MYNLTSSQKELLRWLVQASRSGRLPEDFSILWVSGGTVIAGFKGETKDTPKITQGALDALAANDLLLCHSSLRTSTATSKSGIRVSQSEQSRRCTLTGKAFEAVDADFNAPDISFVRHLTPLADIVSLDPEVKQRCLPILGAGSSDPKLWDSAVRTAGVILENRLRDVGGIGDPNRIGRDLVNDIFGHAGSLAAKFTADSERSGYRDIYAGIVGVFRNPYAHRLIDPSPEDGGAFIVFVNLLLKMLEDLR